MTEKQVLIAMFKRLNADYKIKQSDEYGAYEVLYVSADYVDEDWCRMKKIDPYKANVINTKDYFTSTVTTAYYLNQAGQVIKIDM